MRFEFGVTLYAVISIMKRLAGSESGVPRYKIRREHRECIIACKWRQLLRIQPFHVLLEVLDVRGVQVLVLGRQVDGLVGVGAPCDFYSVVEELGAQDQKRLVNDYNFSTDEDVDGRAKDAGDVSRCDALC
jgi:hypothetical protein